MTVKLLQSTFTGALGMQLFAQAWVPEGPIRAGLALVHGYGEHSDRYHYLVDAVTARGYGVSAFDHRGHGRSPGLRGHIDKWDEFLEDVRASLAAAREQIGLRPLFLFGHSMGGLIALNYALRFPEGLSGVIASAPLLTQPNVSPVLVYASRLMSRVKPDFSLNSGVDAATISRDPAEVDRYKQDTLNHSKATARFATELEKAIDWTQAHAGDLKLPILLYHGSGDGLVPIAGSRTFYANLKGTDKQWIEWPGGYHESHNDLHRDEVFAAILAWLDTHTADL